MSISFHDGSNCVCVISVEQEHWTVIRGLSSPEHSEMLSFGLCLLASLLTRAIKQLTDGSCGADMPSVCSYRHRVYIFKPILEDIAAQEAVDRQKEENLKAASGLAASTPSQQSEVVIKK